LSLLDWRPGKADDQDSLKTFKCTDAPKKVKLPMGNWGPGPAVYEHRVQSLIRTQLNCVGDPSRTVLLGRSEDGALGGVTSYRRLSSSQYVVEVVAVAVRHRHKGGGVAREALATTLDYLTADAVADGYSMVTVSAKVHEKNRPSQFLLTHEGFAQTGDDGDGYQVWAMDLLLT
jgi:RimJ/RimL family protein N-acetyltransferase